MKRAGHCSADHWAGESPSFRTAPSRRHRRGRKRRFAVPRQALGLDLDLLLSYGIPEPVSEPAAPEPLPIPDPADDQPVTTSADPTDKRRRVARNALWTCVIILLLILFRDWIVRFIQESPFAWPSINGDF